MKTNLPIIGGILLTLIVSKTVHCQNYPSYGPEQTVTISGWSFDAMEPFISPDGQYLLFNNKNNGIDTRLFYATWVDDSTFNFAGPLNGTNQPDTPRLDAVPDMDTLNNFYWTSTRGYPANMDNLHYGTFNSGNVTDTGRVRGDFYIYTPSWIVMDHGISYDGQQLYFNNAYFDTCSGPCEARIGVAQKVNDSTFNTLPNSDGLLQNVNDSNFICYAPCITKDNQELYYTRLPKGTITPSTQADICVAVRNSVSDTFSMPTVLFSAPVSDIVEAPTLTADKQIMYYHKKVSGVHKIMMRHRSDTDTAVGIQQTVQKPQLKITPNPTNGQTIIYIEGEPIPPYTLNILDSFGRHYQTFHDYRGRHIQVADLNLPSGLYLIKIAGPDGNVIASDKLIITK